MSNIPKQNFIFFDPKSNSFSIIKPDNSDACTKCKTRFYDRFYTMIDCNFEKLKSCFEEIYKNCINYDKKEVYSVYMCVNCILNFIKEIFKKSPENKLKLILNGKDVILNSEIHRLKNKGTKKDWDNIITDEGSFVKEEGVFIFEF